MIIAIIIGILAALLLGGTYFCYRFCFYSPQGNQNDIYNLPPEDQYMPLRPRIRELIARLDARPYETIKILSEDGLTLRGQYYHKRDGAPLVIFFHGYRSTPHRDGCGLADMLLSKSVNLLLVDQRAHRESKGHTITFGVMESHDAWSWAREAQKRWPDSPVILSGVSMGAATVLMASALPLPENVKGIMADCPYNNAKDILINTGKNMGLPAQLYPFIRLGALLFGGFDPNRGDAVQAVKSAKVPILLIHGEDDRFVPPEMSQEIANANPAITRHTFPRAAHGTSFLEDEERYGKLVEQFMEKVLGR